MKVQTTLIKDTIDLYQGDTLVKSVPFTFNASKCLQDVQHLRAEMIANKAADDMEGVGRVFWELLRIVFGDAALDELRDWYGGDFLTALNDLAPILTGIVYPTVDRLTDSIVQARKRVKA